MAVLQQQIDVVDRRLIVQLPINTKERR